MTKRTPTHDTTTDSEQPAPGENPVREAVRRRYAAAALAAGAPAVGAPAVGGDGHGCGPEPGACCGEGPGVTDEEGRVVFGASLYEPEVAAGADEAALGASLGCGVPTVVADLRPGETVLDLGSGAGADLLISARRVGPRGRAIGLDMTPEMVELARANAARQGATNVELVLGYLEQVPLPDESVDVVISNCVINLAADKHLVLAEAARVLRPGGRFAVSDVVADADMDQATRSDMQSWTGCIAGALSEDEYRAALSAAGLVEVTITPTHRVHAHAAAAIVRAEKPAADAGGPVTAEGRPSSSASAPMGEAEGMGSDGQLRRSSARVAAALGQVAPGAEVRELESSTRTAADAAAALGCEVGAIASSLVFVADDGPLLVMTSGAHRVDLELLAERTGLAGLRKATAAEVRAATGQAIGGVAPVGHPAPLRTLVDADLARYPTIWAAAGTPHAVFATTFEQLLAITAGAVERVSSG